MSEPYSKPHPYRRAPARERAAPHIESFMAEPTPQTSLKYGASIHSTTFSGAWTSEPSQDLMLRTSRHDVSVRDMNLDYHYPNHANRAEELRYQEVQRAERGMPDLPHGWSPDVRYAWGIAQTGGYSSRSERGSHKSTREPQPTTTEHQMFYSQDDPAESLARKSWGYSDLQYLNHQEHQNPSMHQREREACEELRAGPYDAVGYVSRRSDYEKRDEYMQYQYQETYEEESEVTKWEYDDRSSVTLY